MKAIVITRFGPPEVLQLHEVPEPTPGPGEVRVRVRATALNRADLLQRRGRYPAPPGEPDSVPGLEFAGEVEARGEHAGRWAIGQRVMGILGGGGYAEKIRVSERLCVPVPDGIGWEEAAAVPEAFMTSLDALFDRGRLSAGETLLVHAASSGVGTAAVQLADAAGAKVIALSRTPDKRRRLAALGPQRVLDVSGDDLAERIVDAAEGGAVDLVLDLVGASAWKVNVRVLRERGRVVLLGLLGGARGELDLSPLLQKRLTVTGTVLRTRPLEEKAALTREFEERVLPLLATGRVRPVVDTRFPLDRAAEAHRYMERNVHFGKIVLTVGGPPGAGR